VILIVGGYGAVGREIAVRLAPAFPGRVRVAGRNRESADACASGIGHGAEGLHLDVNAPSHRAPALKRGDVVVMCTDQEEPLLAQQALSAGAHYVDITADLRRLEELEQLDSLARRNRATGVLSVGLAPGLTNLRAARATQRLDHPARLDVISSSRPATRTGAQGSTGRSTTSTPALTPPAPVSLTGSAPSPTACASMPVQVARPYPPSASPFPSSEPWRAHSACLTSTAGLRSSRRQRGT